MRKNKIKTTARIAVAIMMIVSFFSVNVFAFDNSSDSSKDAQESFEKTQINDKLSTQEFAKLLYDFAEAGFVDDCTAEEILDARYGDIFKLSMIDSATDEIKETEVWYCPVFVEDKMVLLNRFFFVDGELMYNVSSGYTETFNANKDTANKLYFDKDNDLQVCSSEKEIYDDLIGVDAFARNTDVTDSVGTILDAENRGLVVTSTHVYLSSYPTYYQGSAPLCWAGTIASMVAYEFPSTYGNITISNVCAVTGTYTAATWSVVMSTMNYYFTSPYVPTKLDYCLSFSALTSVIYNNDPALVGGVRTSGSGAHHVALMGYWIYYNARAIEFMNPATGSIEVGSYSSTTPFYFTSGGVQYVWDKTVRLYYS